MATTNIDTILKAEGIAAAIMAATGERPQIVYSADTAKLIFSEQQARRIRSILEAAASAPEGKIKVEIAPVIVPLILKKTWPLIAGSIAGLFLLGYILGKA